MEFGFGVPSRGPLASLENLVALAQKGEELEFDIISVSDHVVVPNSIDSTYPYNESGEFTSSVDGEYMEQLITIGYLAGVTSSIKLLTSVMVLPHRSPVLTAKMLATVDVLSQGRLIVGCGVGWMREEFEAIGAPPFEERGAVGNEYLRVFKELWTSDSPSFDGDYCSFSNISFAPKPVQQPHPPLWIGGESPPALRRAGQLGDAWYPICSNPRFSGRHFRPARRLHVPRARTRQGRRERPRLARLRIQRQLVQRYRGPGGRRGAPAAYR